MALKLDARTISMMAVMTAVVFVFTRAFSIPIGEGYVNFSDIAIYFSAFAFGPWVGLVAGGLGTALADISTGAYAQYAPLSFLAHGLEGLAAGYLVRRMSGNQGYVIAWASGAVLMVAIYFLGEYSMEVWGGAVQASTEWPFNILQNVIGGAVGYALLFGVRRAYPQIDRFSQS